MCLEIGLIKQIDVNFDFWLFFCSFYLMFEFISLLPRSILRTIGNFGRPRRFPEPLPSIKENDTFNWIKNIETTSNFILLLKVKTPTRYKSLLISISCSSQTTKNGVVPCYDDTVPAMRVPLSQFHSGKYKYGNKTTIISTREDT